MYCFNVVLTLLIAAFGQTYCIENATEFPIIELQQGKLKGLEESSTDGKLFYSFYGIPFAEPPIGNLRFEKPVKHAKWEGVLDATKQPKGCIQVDFIDAAIGNPNVTGSEDCLYLNVFTSKPINIKATTAVMVYIHGGGFTSGAAALYPPYVLLNEDIILVVVQYRVGVFGFLSTGDPSIPGNMGLKDQRMALQWVQENIRNFGGDPGAVTIFGESAGAGSVHLHMISPGSKGLFNGVIAQSGSAFCPWAVGSQHRMYADEFGKKLGCVLENNSDVFKKCLQSKDETDLVVTSLSQHKFGITPISTIPRVDGDFLPDDPVTLVKNGKYNQVNLMSGVTRDEGALFAAFMYINPKLKKGLVEDFHTFAPYSLMMDEEINASNVSKAIFDSYLNGKSIEKDPINELVEIFGDSYITMCSDFSSFLHAQDKRIKLYLYQLDHEGKKSFMDLFRLPFPKYVTHVDDLLYLFSGGPYFQPLSFEDEEDIQLRRNITKMWTNFAKFGNPTPLGTFDYTWNPATTASFGHLSITTNPTMMGYQRINRLKLWMSLDTRMNQQLISRNKITPE